MSLPISFKEFIPRIFWQDPICDILADKIDEHLEEWKQDHINLWRMYDPAACSSAFLEELGYFLNAGLSNTDTEHQKRVKIYTAIESHKNRGSWENDAKDKIDSIAGGDAQIIDIIGTSDWILVGDGTTPTDFYWASMGVDGVDDDLGLDLIGESTEIGVAGNVYIDVDNNSLSADELTQIELVLSDIVPAYYIVHLGYMSGGAFVEYSTI
jgi:hypothetical protein